MGGTKHKLKPSPFCTFDSGLECVTGSGIAVVVAVEMETKIYVDEKDSHVRHLAHSRWIT